MAKLYIVVLKEKGHNLGDARYLDQHLHENYTLTSVHNVENPRRFAV